VVLGDADVIDHDIMNAVAFASGCLSSARRVHIRNDYTGAHMADGGIPNGHVGYLADGAYIALKRRLVLRSQHYGVPCLGEPSPVIFEDVVFGQHALRVFQLQMILYDERVSSCSADVAGRAHHPSQRFEEMVLADLYVGGCGGRSASTKQNVLSRCLEKVVHDRVRTAGRGSVATGNGVRISTGPDLGSAVEVIEI